MWLMMSNMPRVVKGNMVSKTASHYRQEGVTVERKNVDPICEDIINSFIRNDALAAKGFDINGIDGV